MTSTYFRCAPASTRRAAPSGNSLPAEILDALPEVVFTTDADGRWTCLNAAWTKGTGLPVEESLGRTFLDYVVP